MDETIWRCDCGRLQPAAGHEPNCPRQYLATAPLTDEDVAHAMLIATEKGWCVDGEFVWDRWDR